MLCRWRAEPKDIYLGTHARGIELLVSFKTLLAEKAYVQIPHEFSRLGTGTLGSLETTLGFCAEPRRD